MGFKYLEDVLGVGNIGLDESIVRLSFDVLEVFKVSGVSQGIYVDDFVGRVLCQNCPYEMRTDESGTAGDENRFFLVGFEAHVNILNEGCTIRCSANLQHYSCFESGVVPLVYSSRQTVLFT